MPFCIVKIFPSPTQLIRKSPYIACNYWQKLMSMGTLRRFWSWSQYNILSQTLTKLLHMLNKKIYHNFRKFGESCKQMLCFGFVHAQKFETRHSGAEVAKAILTVHNITSPQTHTWPSNTGIQYYRGIMYVAIVLCNLYLIACVQLAS